MWRWSGVILFLVTLTAAAVAAPPPAEVAKAVTFVFLADDQGHIRVNPETHVPIPNGTGFFVIVENENGPGAYGYLVTAKHVVQSERGEYYKRIFIRINDKDKGSKFAPIDLLPSGEGQNLFIHTDPSVDIAVVPALPDQNVFDVLGVPMSMIRSKDELKKTSILPGSDVFFAGLFAPYFGDKANVPIFRFGRVAMFPTDCIQWKTSDRPSVCAELYLLETMSFGGNSGSPVFFSLGIDREAGKIYTGSEIILAGVMRGTFNEPRAGVLIQTPNASVPVIGQNVGIAAVTPAYFLREILLSDTLKKFRAGHPIPPPPDGSGSSSP